MGNFSNTVYRDTSDSLVQGIQNRLNNTYYNFSDKKPTTVTYWNINYKMSTLDQGDKEVYHQLGQNTSLRYNRINKFQLYGIERIMLDYQRGELGIESPVEGTAYILPNTIIPFADDYFMINYVKEKPVLFRVVSITPDTLDSGANWYKIQYVLENTNGRSKDILDNKLTVETYEFIESNVGSNLVTLLKSSDADLLKKIDEAYDIIKTFYINLFYRQNIQTFVYSYDDMMIYDPYLIEFMIRTGLFATDDENYMYISQAVHKPTTFALEYAHSIFMDIERVNPALHLNSLYPVPVHDPNSLLVDRMEDYYELSINLHHAYMDPINWLNMDLFDRIVNNKPYQNDDNKDIRDIPIYRDIIIDYMNKNSLPDGKSFEITDAELQQLECMDYTYRKDLFYEIPIILYILKQYTLDAQSNNSYTYDSDYDDYVKSETCYGTND